MAVWRVSFSKADSSHERFARLSFSRQLNARAGTVDHQATLVPFAPRLPSRLALTSQPRVLPAFWTDLDFFPVLR